MNSPLDQFDVFYLLGLRLGSLDLSLFNSLLPLFGLVLLLAAGTSFFSSYLSLMALSWQQTLEGLYRFIHGLLREQAGARALSYVPLVVSLFLFILASNLLSLMPFGIALTSHVSLTLFLSCSLILSLVVLGFFQLKLQYLKLFIPQCPFPLLFLLVPIELFSYFVRAFSLAIRLSANILAGHTLVFIVSSLVLKMMALRSWFFLALAPLLLALLLLEFGVAFLQAYVFVVLFTIYLRDSLYVSSHG